MKKALICNILFLLIGFKIGRDYEIASIMERIYGS